MKQLTLIAMTLMGFIQLNLTAQVSSGRIQRFNEFQSEFVAARNVDVWLPDDYSVTKKYAVLYMHDGQMLFDANSTWNHQEWEVDETMGKLQAKQTIRNFIVVGIWNTGKYRHPEYFPQKAIDYLNENEKRDLFEIKAGEELLMQQGPLADNYLKFIVKELKPFIDRNFSTLSDCSNTFIADSSMGGLISMYAICEYPETFGGAACLSTHWIGTFQTNENPLPCAFLAYFHHHLPSPLTHRIYFDYGTETIDAFYKTHQLKADSILGSNGYDQSNWMTREFQGEDHSENAWKKRLEIPLVFLLK